MKTTLEALIQMSESEYTELVTTFCLYRLAFRSYTDLCVSKGIEPLLLAAALEKLLDADE